MPYTERSHGLVCEKALCRNGTVGSWSNQVAPALWRASQTSRVEVSNELLDPRRWQEGGRLHLGDQRRTGEAAGACSGVELHAAHRLQTLTRKQVVRDAVRT